MAKTTKQTDGDVWTTTMLGCVGPQGLEMRAEVDDALCTICIYAEQAPWFTLQQARSVHEKLGEFIKLAEDYSNGKKGNGNGNE